MPPQCPTAAGSGGRPAGELATSSGSLLAAMRGGGAARITQVVPQLKMFTRLSRANRLVLDSLCALSQTGKIVQPSVTTVYDGTSREQGRCSRLVNLVNAIGTGCDGGMKSKAPQLSIGLRGSETRGSFDRCKPHASARMVCRRPLRRQGEAPASGSLERQGPGAVVPRICPHCPACHCKARPLSAA